jgi:H+/Cl- antiporter ClcA
MVEGLVLLAGWSVFLAMLGVLAFFLLHALLVSAERALNLHRQPHTRRGLFLARVRTLALFALLSPLLLDPFANAVHVHGRTPGGF